MIKRKISKIIDNIDDKYINEAMEYEMLKPETKGQWMKWGIMAACLTIVILAGAIVLPSFLESGVSENRLVTLEEMKRPYSRDLEVEKIVSAYDSGFVEDSKQSVWPTQYLTLAERTDSLSFDENFYEMHGWADESLIGELLGEGDCKIYDSDSLRGQDNIVGTEMFEVYELSAVSEKLMVAVKIEGEFWLFKNRYQELDFGDWINVYNLSENLELNPFSIYDEENEKKYFSLADDSYIWEILFTCKDAEYVGNIGNIWNSVDFAVTIKKMGMYNRFFRITQDGYLWTDIFSGNKSFFIGEETAGKIISYAMENGVEATYEAYEPYALVGYLEEIAEDYILVNDGILCEKKENGTTFKVSLKDIRVRRYVECMKMQVNDLVWIDFREGINVKEENLVCGVFQIGKAVIWDGTKQIINGEGHFIQGVPGAKN